MKRLQELKQSWMTQPAVREAYEAQAAEFSITRELIAARLRAGLTQAQMAERMGTSQSVIARLEGGRRTPSIETVQRYARATGCRAVLKLEPLPG